MHLQSTRHHAAHSVYYECHVSGETRHAPWLTMVHGFSHNHAYFSAQVEAFRADYRILVVDFRGHGGSSAMAGPYGIEEYADDVLTALEEATIEKTHYWGTHTGSAVGLLLTYRQPQRVRSLVLESAVLPGFDMPKVGELLNRARSIAQTEGIEAARRDWFDHADWFDYIRAHPERCRATAHRELVEKFEGAPWLSTLTPRPITRIMDCMQTITPPTLLYNGQYDLPDFKKAAVALEVGLLQVHRHEIAEAGGFAGWENPKAVNALVKTFLTRLAERT